MEPKIIIEKLKSYLEASILGLEEKMDVLSIFCKADGPKDAALLTKEAFCEVLDYIEKLEAVQ